MIVILGILAGAVGVLLKTVPANYTIDNSGGISAIPGNPDNCS